MLLCVIRFEEIIGAHKYYYVSQAYKKLTLTRKSYDNLTSLQNGTVVESR